MKKKDVKKHLDNLIYNWFDDEKKDYSSVFNVDFPDSIKTEKLKNHNYKDLRVLKDFFHSNIKL